MHEIINAIFHRNGDCAFDWFALLFFYTVDGSSFFVEFDCLPLVCPNLPCNKKTPFSRETERGEVYLEPRGLDLGWRNWGSRGWGSSASGQLFIADVFLLHFGLGEFQNLMAAFRRDLLEACLCGPELFQREFRSW